MYALETTIAVNQSGDAKLKYEASHWQADTAFVGRPLGPSQKRRHEAISAVERRNEPWMKNLTLSSKDLIWGSCSNKEEEFMEALHPKSSSVSQSFGSMPSDPLAKMAAALSSIAGNHTRLSMPTNAGSDLSIKCNQQQQHGGLPRFRQDKIMDHGDVELKMQEFQTSLLRSMSSDSLPPSALEMPQLSYSHSFVASQREIMSQIVRDSESRISRDSEDNASFSLEQGATHSDTDGSSQMALSATRLLRSPEPSLPFLKYSEETLNGMGSKVRIHDEERVFAAMDEGTASLIRCVGCARHMMATSDMKLVYCPGCSTLTPFGMGLVSAGGTTSGADAEPPKW